MRIHELAKELGVESKEIMASLSEMGYEGRTASSTVPEEAVPRLRASGGRVKPGSKPIAATAQQLPTRRAPEPEETELQAPSTNGEVELAAVGTLAPAVEPEAPPAPPVKEAAAPDATAVRVPRGSTPQELADKLGASAADIVKLLFQAGEMVSIAQSLSDDAIELVATELARPVEIVSPQDEEPDLAEEEPVDESKLVPRPPVVTVMGHVDHGKTLLLDAIRETDVVAGEFGGITQHIGAYQAHVNGREITFIDTPGHEAFTAMRARGAQITDIAVLVVAADDGVMPQTVEALDHARAAGVPVIVAVNKIDKEEADPNRVRTQMVERGLVPSEWGGDTEFVDVSAKTNANLEGLLETVLIVADLAELKGDPTGHARGTVLEAHLDKGRGPVATVLVQKGRLEVGDALVCGTTYCKVRAMVDENGQPVDVAGPAKPAQVLGWNGVPNVGDEFREVEDEREARHIAAERESRVRSAEVVNQRPASLQELLRRQERSEIPELNLVVKADVQGSLGALTDAFLKLPQDEVRVNLVHSGAGAITEHDVDLAKTATAIVVGFNVRPNANARELA